jgi:hypothetical protein
MVIARACLDRNAANGLQASSWENYRKMKKNYTSSSQAKTCGCINNVQKELQFG